MSTGLRSLQYFPLCDNNFLYVIFSPCIFFIPNINSSTPEENSASPDQQYQNEPQNLASAGGDRDGTAMDIKSCLYLEHWLSLTSSQSAPGMAVILGTLKVFLCRTAPILGNLDFDLTFVVKYINAIPSSQP